MTEQPLKMPDALREVLEHFANSIWDEIDAKAAGHPELLDQYKVFGPVMRDWFVRGYLQGADDMIAAGERARVTSAWRATSNVGSNPTPVGAQGDADGIRTGGLKVPPAPGCSATKPERNSAEATKTRNSAKGDSYQ